MIEKDWQEFNNRIAKYMMGDISNFTNWDVIRYAMFSIPPQSALFHLQSLPDWPKWEKAIEESPIGNPEPYKTYPKSSGNLIAQADHLSYFLMLTDCKIENFQTIFEFGAGYGCMCRLIYNLGFNGKYVIMDLPALLNLQRYYLGNTAKGRDIEYLSKEDEFIKRISESRDDSLFIAAWSISETDFEFRRRILNSVCDNIRYILIGYQYIHRSFNNKYFFYKFAENREDFKWKRAEVPHRRNIKHNIFDYLFGERK